MFIKIFIKIKVCLNLVIDHEIQSFLILLIKKVIGKMKDELKGKIISEFVALKSKKYSWIEVVDGEILEKAEGVNKSVINNVRHK